MRTPRLAEELAAEEKATYERVTAGHQRMRRAALNLLAHRQHFPVVGDLDDWWEGLAEQLDGLDDTPTGQASVRAHVKVIIRDIQGHAALAEAPHATNPEAVQAMREALAAAEASDTPRREPT